MHGKTHKNIKQIIERVKSGDLSLEDDISIVSSVPVFQSGDSIEITYDKYGFYKDPSIKITTMTVKEYLSSV